MTTPPHRLAAILLAAASLTLSSCGGGNSTSTAKGATITPEVTTSTNPPDDDRGGAGDGDGEHPDHAHTEGMDHGGHDDAADDKGWSALHNGHQHETGAVALDAATQAELDGQLALTAELIDKYPTIADAEAAGWRRAGPFSPGLGTHYGEPNYHMNNDGDMDPEDMPHPMLVFDGVEPDAPLAGFMYVAYMKDEPEGFVGPNDHWHFHTDVCIVRTPDGRIDTPFGADTGNITTEQCDGVGGILLDFTGYMVHVWNVPGYASPDGMFTELNRAITCEDGTYHRIEIEDIGDRRSVCLDAS